MVTKTKKRETKLEAPLYTKTGKKVGTVELRPEIFGVPFNKRFIDTVLVAYGGKQRRGVAATKERSEVRGGGKKPWRQKGTGRARAGSIRSPLWRGGGTTFGPHPRGYGAELPKKMRKKALASALSFVQGHNRLLFINDRTLDAPKTKELVQILKALKLIDVRSVFVVSQIDENLKRASGNIKELVSVKSAQDVNAYHILKRKNVLIEKNALTALETRLLGQEPPAGKKKTSTKE